MQEKFSLPFSLLCLKAKYKIVLFWRQILTSPEIHQRNLQTNLTPYFPPIYFPTGCHPWKPKTVFLCPVISLQIYYSLLNMLYKLEF